MRKLLLVFVLSLVFSPLMAGDKPRFLDVIVSLDTGFALGEHSANRSAAAEIARGFGVEPTATWGTALFGFAARIPEGRLAALRNDPRVAYVEMDRSFSLAGRGELAAVFAASVAQTVPWSVTRIGAGPGANEGAGVHVYVIDSGIAPSHPDLQANLGNGFASWKCTGSGCQGKSWGDDLGHGTNVAGIIGAIDNGIDLVGVASRVTLHSVKVCGNFGTICDVSKAITGIDWVAKEVKTRGQPAAANMSFVFPGAKTGQCTASGFTGSDALHQALCNATRTGVVFAAGAGNGGLDTETQVPAAYDDAVMGVSATTQSNDWPDWSGWGDNTASWTSSPSAPVTLAAPGVGIPVLTREGTIAVFNGTSLSTPHVTGAIALYLASHPQAAAYSAFLNTRAALLAAAEDTGGFSNTSGHPHAEGFLNASGF
ncbi:MAG TPA: S8 family serine peptidase [Thermoanaerobaculia bacterium]|jgi:subtilisin